MAVCEGVKWGVCVLKRKDNYKTLGCVCWMRVRGGVGMVTLCV